MGTSRAQQAVLEALLGRQTLPGSAEPLLVPDLPDLGAAPVVLVASAELDPATVLPQGLRTVDDAAEPDAEPGTAVLELLGPEAFPDRESVRVRVSRLDDQHRTVPLGEVVVTFVEGDDGDLMVTEPTHVLGY